MFFLTSRRIQTLALLSVAFVYVLPLLVAGRRGMIANSTGLGIWIATVPIAALASALPVAASCVWQAMRNRSVRPRVVLALVLLVPAVATLPGMVDVHRAMGWSSNYLPHIFPSLVLIVLNITFFLNLSALRGRTGSQDSIYGALIIASATNLALPWLPLD
jgi:hypothetical protein